jgi:hypothetical protein
MYVPLDAATAAGAAIALGAAGPRGLVELRLVGGKLNALIPELPAVRLFHSRTIAGRKQRRRAGALRLVIGVIAAQGVQGWNLIVPARQTSPLRAPRSPGGVERAQPAGTD